MCGGRNDNNVIYKMQKKGLRLVKGVKNEVSCRNLFGDFKILTVISLCIFLILCFIKKSKISTTQYFYIHKYDTKRRQGLYIQLCSTTHCKKGVISMGTKTCKQVSL
jgi:hypothetical protein